MLSVFLNMIVVTQQCVLATLPCQAVQVDQSHSIFAVSQTGTAFFFFFFLFNQLPSDGHRHCFYLTSNPAHLGTIQPFLYNLPQRADARLMWPGLGILTKILQVPFPLKVSSTLVIAVSTQHTNLFYLLEGSFVHWLVGSLVSWFSGQLVCSLIDDLVHWLID